MYWYFLIKWRHLVSKQGVSRSEPPTPMIHSHTTEPFSGSDRRLQWRFFLNQKKTPRRQSICGYPTLCEDHLESKDQEWTSADRLGNFGWVCFFNWGSPGRGTEGDRNLPVTRDETGRQVRSTPFMESKWSRRKVLLETLLIVLYYLFPPTKNIASHGEKVRFSF